MINPNEQHADALAEGFPDHETMRHERERPGLRTLMGE